MNKKQDNLRVKIIVPKGYDIEDLLCSDFDNSEDEPIFTEEVEIEFESSGEKDSDKK